MIKIINKENIEDIIDIDLKQIYLLIIKNITCYKAYTNFPIFNGGVFNDTFHIDLCLNTAKGIICVCKTDYKNISDIIGYQDMVYNLFETSLRKNPLMIEHRKLISPITICTLAKNISINDVILSGENLIFNDVSQIKNIIEGINEFKEISLECMKKVNSGIQGAYGTINRTKRNFTIGTKSEIVSKLNDCIEEYDDNQFKAIFSEGGIQRIRGMAGSGKTIVIARKAAQLHMENPLWNIVVTYSTRSQKHQLERLIKNYYMKITDGQTPNFNNLRVMHSWGSSNANGLYYEICLTNNITPLTYGVARSLFRKNNIFDKTCERFLNECPNPNKVYDCIIIDEAQDFKSNFFSMCLKTLKEERLIYAYDELQNLGGESMDPPEKLFFKKKIIDTPLKVCYRNQKNVITSAHALGLGLYSKTGLMQIPSENTVWEAIGYQSNCKIENGKDVILYRPKEFSPNLIEISEDEVITCNNCSDSKNQISQTIRLIKDLIEREKLLPTDLMIIDMDTINAEENYKKFKSYTDETSPLLHYAGGVSKDEFFREDSVVYSTIFRAKGNESFYVIILNAQKLYNSITDISERNSLFTAITRSKGWVKLLGFGDGMIELMEEFDKIKNNNYQLNFTPYPSSEDMKKIRKYNMELSKTEENSINITKEMIKKLLLDSKKDPLVIAKDIFNVQSKEELISLLFGDKDEEN